MQLESRLERTTLGDVLGTMYREKFTGCLTLTDLRFASHRIHLRAGCPTAVESPLSAPKLGEVLLRTRPSDITRRAIERSVLSPRGKPLGQNLLAEGCINQAELAAALLEQTRERLQQLFALKSASIRANLGNTGPNTNCLPLSPDAFLHQRPRSETRGAQAPTDQRSGSTKGPERRSGQAEPARLRALALLGFRDQEPSLGEVRRAFRSLAARFHPDRATALAERAARTQKLAELTAAYHVLL